MPVLPKWQTSTDYCASLRFLNWRFKVERYKFSELSIFNCRYYYLFLEAKRQGKFHNLISVTQNEIFVDFEHKKVVKGGQVGLFQKVFKEEHSKNLIKG